ELYYYSPRDNYSMGLEPRFLYTYSPKLYWLATHISNDGYVCDVQACDDLKQAAIKAFVKDGSSLAWAKDEGDKIATVLVGQFKASYVIAGKEYLVLNYIMDHNSHFTRELYDNQYGYAVYKVN
ncbi:MAG: hypothetical protein KGI59_00995, partial [Patescibacteria group bacterium]|nr:hypothetical protein [Patescibacteria group bacterium]